MTGYSVSTVSRVINGYPYVREDKKQKILAVIKETNYIPNHNARNLSYGKTKNIGVILPYLHYPYFDELISGITQQAFTYGYKVTLLPTGYSRTAELNYLQEFAAKSFDALIITSRGNALKKILPFLEYGQIVFCEEVQEAHQNCIFIDREAAIREVFQFLKEKNIQKIGLTLGRSENISLNSKITRRICKEYFPSFCEDQVVWNCSSEKDGRRIAEYFREVEVDAIFANGDMVTASILREGFARPVIGQDNLFISEVMGFSTIDYHLNLCGKRAVDLAIKESKENVHLPYQFIPRGFSD